MRFETEKREIIGRFRRLYESGMINMFEGNISVRAGDVILMTPSQMEKEKITPAMITEMDIDGNVLNEPEVKASSEYKLHLAVYRLRDDIRAVVHTHSTYATACAVSGIPVAGNMAEIFMFFGGEIPVCTYGAPGSEAIYADFPRYFVDEDRDAVLLANHGVVTAGRTLAEAYSKTEAAEKIAKINAIVHESGSELVLPEEEREKLLDFYRKRK